LTQTAIFMRARCYLAAALVGLACVGTAAAGTAVPHLLFPVVGAVTYTNDFGEPRAGGPHQGNDLVAAKRAPVVAVEDGTVEWWTTSASAGCMLYLHGDSGTMYEYIHLNNDLTAGNDNRGTCVKGVAYAVADGTHVVAGQQIGYVGDSGDANGIHPHLHFEVHPHGKNAVSPYPYLQKATHLLVPAPPSGMGFTLRLTGTVVDATDTELTIAAATLASWPMHVKQTRLNRELTLTLDAPVDVARGERIVVWTKLAPATAETISGAPGALTVDRVA
jgi:hypothetical protein